MCAMCKSYPCVPACPNAPEQTNYGCCKICKDHIQDGEEFVNIDDTLYHFDCLSMRDVLKMFDIDIEEAGG